MKYVVRKMTGPPRTIQVRTVGTYSQNKPYKGPKHIAKMRNKGARRHENMDG